MITEGLWKGSAIALAVACLGLLAWGGYQRHERTVAEDTVISQKASWDVAKGKSDQALKDLQGRFDKQTLAWAEDKKTNDQKVKDEQAKTTLAVAAAATERDRLRDKTAQYTALANVSRSTLVVGTPEYSAAVVRLEGRAATLGQLLVQCDAVAEGLGRQAEGLATQVRGLQTQYLSLK
ncbi:hypothetical protein Lumi_034 [Xylophilus phage Lumi]|nr:hypothetical protein Lumi_034 [Xylophilus phage Lumi]